MDLFLLTKNIRSWPGVPAGDVLLVFPPAALAAADRQAPPDLHLRPRPRQLRARAARRQAGVLRPAARRARHPHAGPHQVQRHGHVRVKMSRIVTSCHGHVIMS